ncbi:hypothetical protein D3C73_1091940 [compost metagenome]
MKNHFSINPEAFERGMNDAKTKKEYQECVDELITIEIQIADVKSDYLLNLLNARKNALISRIKTMFDRCPYTPGVMFEIYNYSNNKENFEH